MAVITVSKEFASGGVALARQLAQDLGWRLAGRDILAKVAEATGLSEAEAELLHRGQETRWISLVDEYLLHTVRKIAQKPEQALDDSDYFASVQKLVRGLADEGDVVVVGWGGQLILADHPQAVHLRVVAPLAERAQRLAADRGISQVQAEAECQRQDGFSSAYIKAYLKADWADPLHYNLVINLGRQGFDLDKAVVTAKTLL